MGFKCLDCGDVVDDEFAPCPVCKCCSICCNCTTTDYRVEIRALQHIILKMNKKIKDGNK